MPDPRWCVLSSRFVPLISPQDRQPRWSRYPFAVIDDARTIPDDSVLTADLCIIGGGAAGIAIGRELAGSSLRVVILESGGLDYETAVNDLDRGDIVGLPYFPLETARLRYFGG